MLRAMPGSIRDAATFVGSLQKARTPLVLSRRHTSTRYETRIPLTDYFFYHKRLIHAGKGEMGGVTHYLYEDIDLVADKEKNALPVAEEDQIDWETLNRRLKRAGRILIVSSLTAEFREIHDLYKSWNLVEDHFAALKGLIQVDKLYLWGQRWPSATSLLVPLPLPPLLDSGPDQAGGADRAPITPRDCSWNSQRSMQRRVVRRGGSPWCPNRYRRSGRNSNSAYSLM